MKIDGKRVFLMKCSEKDINRHLSIVKLERHQQMLSHLRLVARRYPTRHNKALVETLSIQCRLIALEAERGL